MRIIDVDPLFESDNPQLAQLNQLLATAKEPWEAAQYKWRIQNLQNSIDVGKGAPTDANGQLKPVVDARTWMKQNPSLIKVLPKEALPPEMQQPGVLDKIGNAIGKGADAVFNWADNLPNSKTNLERDKQQNRDDASGVMREGQWYGSNAYDPDYQGPGQYNNEVEELEGLLSQTAFSSEEMQRRDFLSKKYGINGPEDLPKLQAIKDKELARIGGVQQSRIAAGAAADAKADAEHERELALRAKYGHLAPQGDQQQSLQENIELDRIKYLSKVLRG